MKKKIKNLKQYELQDICFNHVLDCSECPLAIIKGCEVICLKQEINKTIEIKQEKEKENE